MNLYLIKRPDEPGYDEYDAAVVAAESAEDAEKIEPGRSGWVHHSRVTVLLLGIAKPGIEKGVVLASFNAG